MNEKDYRSAVLQRIEAPTIPHPYFDEVALLASGNKAYRVARMLGREPVTAGELNYQEGFVPEANMCCWYADRVLRDRIRDLGLRKYEVADVLGMDGSVTSLYTRFKRKFSCPLDRVQAITAMLNLTPNEFLRGEPGQLVIPKFESALIQYLMKIPDKYVAILAQTAKQLWITYRKEHPATPKDGLSRAYNELFADRFKLMNREKMTPVSLFFGPTAPENPSPLREIADFAYDIGVLLDKKYAYESNLPGAEPLTEEEKTAIDTPLTTQVASMIPVMVESQYPADWFFSEELITDRPNRGMKILYTNQDGEQVVLERTDLRSLFNSYFALPGPLRGQLYKDISVAILENTDMAQRKRAIDAMKMVKAGIEIEDAARYAELPVHIIQEMLEENPN